MDTTRAQYENPSNTHTPSMLLDAQKSLPIEVEVIFGEVVRLAREFNVPVPVGFGQTAIHSTYSAPAD